jgi:hypothetical protein
MSSVNLITACGPVKFYPGEERADSEVGRVLFNTTGAEMIAVTIDGIPHPHPGRTVEVLPGPHRIEVQFQERIAPSDRLALEQASTPQPLPATFRFGTCTIRFTIDAAQELFLYVDAGSPTSLPSSTPPTITLKEQGYDKPALFQERCREESSR